MIISKRGNNYTTRAQYRRRVLKRRSSRQRAARHEVAAILFICVFVLITILSALRLVTTYAQPTFEAVVEKEPLETTTVEERTEVVFNDAQQAQATTQTAGLVSDKTDTIKEPKEPVFVPLPVPMSEEDQRIVFDICKDYNVSFSLVMGLIGHETEYTKEARSETGDSGYMQINDCNVEAMAARGYTDLLDTADNVGAGVSILCDLFNTYGEDEVHKVLMAYNMGAGRAAELWAQGVTTSEYSRDIVRRERELSAYIDEQLGLQQ